MTFLTCFEDGDRLFIPSRRQRSACSARSITRTLPFKDGKRIGDYLASRRPTREADKGSLYLIKGTARWSANGRAAVLQLLRRPERRAGDAIVVPEELIKASGPELMIEPLFQFALGVAGLKVLGDL
jgi:hypothetical protein